MEIVVCTDRNYIMPCGVLLQSICQNSNNSQISFNVVIDESVSDHDKDVLRKIATVTPLVKVNFYSIDGHIFDNFPSLGNGIYVTKATYYRIYLTKILPSTMDKVLYLDCDMVVRKDLADLWNKDIDNKAAAVALDGMDGMAPLYNRLNYPMEKGYFNAGMMLINLKYWRENQILEKCLDFITNHYDSIVSHDQDVLNFVLQDSKENVEITYNFGECFLYKPRYMQFNYLKHKPEIETYIKDPAIVHYTISKPWRKGCLNPFKELFLKYRSQTIWKDMPLENDKFSIRKMIKNILIMLKIKQKEPNIYNDTEFDL